MLLINTIKHEQDLYENVAFEMLDFDLEGAVGKLIVYFSNSSFYFERILERISKSNYRGQIILKGGLLLTSIIGDDERTTKDMDATLKGIPLTRDDGKKYLAKYLVSILMMVYYFKLYLLKILD